MSLSVALVMMVLLSNTDRIDCCRSSDNPNGGTQGHWYYPNGEEVGSYTEGYAYSPMDTFLPEVGGVE